MSFSLDVGLGLGGGGGGGWTPARLPNQSAWYRADNGLTADAGAAEDWEDLFGIQAPFLASGAARPTLVDEVAALNDKAALLFNGAVPSFMTSADASSWDLINSSDIYVVLRMTAVTTFNNILTKWNPAEWDHYITGGAIVTVHGFNPATSSLSGLLAADTSIVVNMRQNGTAVSWKVNGNSLGSGTIPLPSAGTTDVYIGKRADGLTTFTGYLSEIVAMTSPLPAGDDLDALEDYFGSRYGIAMA